MLNRFCCMTLHTAGMVIGWLGVVGSVFYLAYFSWILGNQESWIERVKDPNMDTDMIASVITGVLIVFIITTCVSLVASAMLILGTLKKRHLLLVPWLINSGLSLFFSTILMLVGLLSMISSAPASAIFFSWLIAGLVFAINFYIWYAVYSLYKNIKANSGQQHQLLRPVGFVDPTYTKQ